MQAMHGGHEDQCEWCHQGPWQYRCGMCDPRRVKQVCVACTRRWHSRGYSREHVLEDRHGVKQRFAQFLAQDTTLASAAPSLTPVVPVHGGVQDKAVPPAAEVSQPAEEQSVPPPLPPSPPPPPPPGNTVSIRSADGPSESEPSVAMADDDASAPQVNGDAPALDESALQPPSPSPSPSPPLPPVSNDSDDGKPPETTPTGLLEVLARFPTEETAVLDALADCIHSAIKVEDAVLCIKFDKCDEASCAEIARHYTHAAQSACCGEEQCQLITTFVAHMRSCALATCPFCVRLKQRRLLCRRRNYEQKVFKQKRLLRELRESNPTANDEDNARVNFVTAQIKAYELKKLKATADVESLNRVVVENKLPIFNFPAMSWHVPAVPIKQEPDAHPANDGVGASLVPSEPATPIANESEAEVERQDTDTHPTPLSMSTTNSVTDTPPQAQNHVAALLRSKEQGLDGATAAFEKSMQFAFRIVDASFCSQAKASRCLLDCQEILIHLQHHVDMNVCSEKTCEVVEYHFLHVSKCRSAGAADKCEYCLRVTEREYARAVEVMESDQLDSEARAQSLIRALTDSLSNDPHDEREQTVMQLEDELQQAEDYKTELMEKLNVARANLRRARRRMSRHPSNLSYSEASLLPRHFIKVRVNQHHHASKRRKA